MLLFIGLGTLSVLHTKSAFHVAEAMEAIENNLLETGSSFEEGGMIIVLKSESSKFKGVSKELKEKILKIGASSIESLSDLPDEYLNTDGSLSAVTAPTLYEHYENTPFKQILYIKLEKLDFDSLTNAIYELQNFTEVESVEPNWIQTECSTNSNYFNDPYYSDQWGLNSIEGIHVEGAWNRTRGNNRVRVGVIDSGIAYHDDLIDNLSLGYDFYNWDSNTHDPMDGHGTHVAGIIAATCNNSMGISGVVPTVSVVPLQTSNDDSILNLHDDKVRIEAINYATTYWDTGNRISILNHSIGGFGLLTGIAAAVNNYPGLFVWAAGNSIPTDPNVDAGKNLDDYYKEDIINFNLPNLISVGAIDKDGKRVRDTNYGCKSVNIYAPGEDIISTFPAEFCEKGNCESVEGEHIANGYHKLSGTSMAAPFVTGVAALMLSVNPNLSAEALKHYILEGSDDIQIEAKNAKKLNAEKAVELARREEPCFTFDQDRYLYAVKYRWDAGCGGDRVAMSENDNNYTIYGASYTEIMFPDHSAADRMLCIPSGHYYRTYNSSKGTYSRTITFNEKTNAQVGLNRQRMPKVEYIKSSSDGDELPTSHNHQNYWWDHNGKAGQYIIATLKIGSTVKNLKIKIPLYLFYEREPISVGDFKIEVRVGNDRVSIKSNKTNVSNVAFNFAFDVVDKDDEIFKKVIFDN